MDVKTEIEGARKRLDAVATELLKAEARVKELTAILHGVRGGLAVLEELDGDSDDNSRADTE